jgi:hypothetical protein
MVCLRAFPAVSPPVDINVSLTVEPIAELTLTNPEGIGMATVEKDWMNTTRTSQGSVGVDIKTNFRGTLRCADNVTLEYNSMTYSVPVGVVLLGPNTAYYSGHSVCLDFEPGTGRAYVVASLSKPWSYGDRPGTYLGTITLEYVSR